MRRAFRITALVVGLGALGVWVAAGANPGWTKTSVPVRTVDDVTGLEAVSYRNRFVPGLDLLGAALLGAAGLAGAPFLFRRAANPNH
jgi:hypothetical protein